MVSPAAGLTAKVEVISPAAISPNDKKNTVIINITENRAFLLMKIHLTGIIVPEYKKIMLL